ncbi:MAG: 2-C-methyl-D-erythritol 4-phosphate cytidylyltransferase [Myxococcota bacterium]
MQVAALVLGAGSGTRLRATLPTAPPKAWLRLAGRTLLGRSLDALAAVPGIELLQPVIPEAAFAQWPEVEAELRAPGRVAPPVAGGRERQDSVRAGLAALSAGVSHVAVHDAARPLVRADAVARVVEAARAHGAALLATPAGDTIHRVRDGHVVSTPPRAECFAAQTPQVFRVDWLREALAKALAEGIVASDDAALVARLGVRVHVVPGDPDNLKITTASDLALAEALLAAREAGA